MTDNARRIEHRRSTRLAPHGIMATRRGMKFLDEAKVQVRSSDGGYGCVGGSAARSSSSLAGSPAVTAAAAANTMIDYRHHQAAIGFLQIHFPWAKRAPPHSITSSARATSVAGISKLIALAVLRLTTNWNLVGWKNGMSPGFMPVRT